MNQRLDRLRSTLTLALPEPGLTAWLVHDPVEVAYLTGFRGSTASVVVTPEHAIFITDGRYAEQARRECEGVEIRVIASGQTIDRLLADIVLELGVVRLGVDGDHLSVNRLSALAALMSEVILVPLPNPVQQLRQVKDADEIATMRRACALVDRAFERFLEVVRPGVREIDVAAELEFWIKARGAEDRAFDTIVASGVRSALPHGRASEKEIERGDFVTLDFGARIDGYNSDLTRTVVVGPATARQREVHTAVLKAQQAGLDAIRPGASGRDVDAAARASFAAAGMLEHFPHGLGHGLGRVVHDHVAFSQRSELILQPGMIVTVEPGLYFPGWGGCRIEEDVLVTDGGAELLTRSSRELIEIGI